MEADAIFDDLTALADATRSRMLLLLERHELTVSELCAVLQLPQSTVSRHLKTLSRRRVGLVAPRRHEPLLHARSGRSRAGDPPSVGAAARAGEPDPRRRSGRAAAPRRARAAADEVAGVLRSRPRAVGPPARGSLRPRVASPRAAGAARRRIGSSATSVAARARSRRRLHRSSPGHRRRSLGRHAAGRASPGARRFRNVDVRRGELEALPIAGRRARRRDAAARAAPPARIRPRRSPRPRGC